ncbi:MAG: DUF4157 domain-containing protein [Pseudomonadota bacterium]
MPEPGDSGPSMAITPVRSARPVQRACADCEAERHPGAADRTLRRVTEENNVVQTTEMPGNLPEPTASKEHTISSLNGGGSPIPKLERAFFETRFRRSFENVRLHTGRSADAATKSINARAFTYGNDIVFAAGEYRPGSAEGRHLIAHELVHTVQQSKSNTSSYLQRSVRKCCRGIQTENSGTNALADLFGLQHCWIKTDSREAGMGAAINGLLPDNPIVRETEITDHTGDQGFCNVVPNIDESCVDQALKIGRPLGIWGPVNNCNTFVDQTLASCSPLSFERRYLSGGGYMDERGFVSPGFGPKY